MDQLPTVTVSPEVRHRVMETLDQFPALTQTAFTQPLEETTERRCYSASCEGPFCPSVSLTACALFSLSLSLSLSLSSLSLSLSDCLTDRLHSFFCLFTHHATHTRVRARAHTSLSLSLSLSLYL